MPFETVKGLLITYKRWRRVGLRSTGQTLERDNYATRSLSLRMHGKHGCPSIKVSRVGIFTCNKKQAEEVRTKNGPR